MEKKIIFCGQPAKVKCDEKCNKAWGMNNRPRVYLDIHDELIFGLMSNGESVEPSEFTLNRIDVDNYAYCSDDELGDAPIDPKTYEDDQAKPTNKSEIGNAWCIRECERCEMSMPNRSEEPLELIDFSKRFYNYQPHVRD